MLMSPPPGYSPPAMNRQAAPLLGQPGIQSLPAQGHTPGPTMPAPGPSSYAPPSNQPMPQQPGQPWGALGPQHLNHVINALGARTR